jgi:hypothetical protein
MQIAVVQFVLLNDVVLQAIEVFFGQQLAGEEAWAAETL